MAFVINKNGHWTIAYRDAAGRLRREASKARTKSEAQRLADERERKERRIHLGLEDETPQALTWKQLSGHYLRDVVPNHESAKTTESQMKHLAPLDGKLLHQITPADIERILTSKRETLSEATREKIRKRAQTMFRYAKESLRAFRGENPAALVKRLRPPVRRPKYLAPEDVPRVLRAAGDDEDLMATAFYTGMRKGELCGLKPADVDLRARAIHLQRSYSKTTTKGRRDRVVYVHNELVPYLRRALARADDEGHAFLFPDAKGRMRTKHWDAADAFRQCLKRAGLVSGHRHMCRRARCGFREERKDDAVSRCPKCGFVLWVDAIPMEFTFKHARSTWGTHAYRATGDIRFVQEGLGHTDISVTMAHYSHALVEHQLEQTNKMSFALPSGTVLGHGRGKTVPKPAIESEAVREKEEKKQ